MSYLQSRHRSQGSLFRCHPSPRRHSFREFERKGRPHHSGHFQQHSQQGFPFHSLSFNYFLSLGWRTRDQERSSSPDGPMQDSEDIGTHGIQEIRRYRSGRRHRLPQRTTSLVRSRFELFRRILYRGIPVFPSLFITLTSRFAPEDSNGLQYTNRTSSGGKMPPNSTKRTLNC